MSNLNAMITSLTGRNADEVAKLLNNFSLIEYEFELEREIRYLIEPLDDAEMKWVNHVLDTYDASGRCRIRVKNGEPRLSLKIPLFSQDTPTAKTCIRIELKPQTDEQKAELLRIRDLIAAEPGSQQAEKWGAPITTSSGVKVWVNRNGSGKWWVEVDEGIELLLPEGMKVIATEKSQIKMS
jgi:hypothetical protein